MAYLAIYYTYLYSSQPYNISLQGLYNKICSNYIFNCKKSGAIYIYIYMCV